MSAEVLWSGKTGWALTPISVYLFGRDSVIGVRYRNEILKPYFYLFRGAGATDFILMDNNARSHRDPLVDEFVESGDIRQMDWPVRSLELNQLDHASDALRRAIAIPSLSPRTTQGLKKPFWRSKTDYHKDS